MELGKDLNHIIKRENMLEKQYNAEFEKTEQLYLALLLISHTKMEFATPEVLMLGLCLMSEGGGLYVFLLACIIVSFLGAAGRLRKVGYQI